MQATETKVGTVPEHECDDVRWVFPSVKWIGREFRQVWICQCGYAFRRVHVVE